MADLSAYVDFSVLLDKSGTSPVIVLTDTSNYPSGVAATITGVFSVTQPDGISLSGNFNTPDISLSSPFVNPCSKELRLSSDNSFQNGNYSVTYVAKATGYADTVKTKTITLNYTKATPQITDLTNPFVPSIQVIDGDGTKYAVAGFTLNTVVRNWSGVINNADGQIPTITSNSVLLDLRYNGSYYDADYKITLISIASYVSNDYAWVSLKDIFSNADAPLALSVYTPPTLVELRNNLTAMRLQVLNGTYCGGCCNGCGDNLEPFNTAQNLFDLFVQNGQNDQNVYTLYDYVLQMQALFYCSALPKQQHTFLPIPDYDWGVTPVIVPTTRKPLQFTVGGTMPFAPANGDVNYINPDLQGLVGYAIFSQADADYLTEGIDFDYNPSQGGWSWRGGRTFITGEQYTQIF